MKRLTISLQTLLVCSFVLIGLLVPSGRLLAQEAPNDGTPIPGIPRIVGGQAAAPGEWPWQVLVLPGDFLCGGSLVNPEWVLTAAHCIFDLEGSPIHPAEIFIIAGEHDLVVNEGPEQRRGVAKVSVHPNYDEFTADNDIALLKLSSPVVLNDRVATISLVDATLENSIGSPGMLATVTGWGALAEGSGGARFLQEVSLPIVSNGTCNGTYEGAITSNMLCAGFDQGGKDACQGDSGGPLMVTNGNGGWLQLGIVSWGDGCARAARYGVYTRVPNYVDWIESQINEITFDPMLVAVESGVILPGASEATFVTVRVSDIPEETMLGAITFDLHFDPDLVKATFCLEPENTHFDQTACGRDAAGVLRISALSATGISSDADVVRIGFEQIGGDAGASSVLKLVNIKPIDVEGRSLPAEHRDGELRLGCAPGDVTCDGEVTGTDAMFVLQFTDGLRAGSNEVPPPAGALYLPACDVDGNEACDAVDADLVLQCDAFIANALCPPDKGTVEQQ